MSEKEKVLFENQLGLVSDRRIVFKQKLGYDSIPIEKVSSVSLGHRRNNVAIFIYFGLICAIIGLFIYLVLEEKVPPGGLGGTELIILLMPIIVLFILGLIKLVGYYYVQVTMVGEGRKMVKVSILKAKGARLLVEAINRKVFE